MVGLAARCICCVAYVGTCIAGAMLRDDWGLPGCVCDCIHDAAEARGVGIRANKGADYQQQTGSTRQMLHIQLLYELPIRM